MSSHTERPKNPRIILGKLLLLLLGLVFASIGFLYLLSLADRQDEKREAAKAERWGQEMARQDQVFEALRAELRRALASPSTTTNREAGQLQQSLQPTLILKPGEAFMLSNRCLRKIVSLVDLSTVRAVTLTVMQRPTNAIAQGDAPPAEGFLHAHVFSYPAKKLLLTESFSTRPPRETPADAMTLGVSSLLPGNIDLRGRLDLLHQEEAVEARFHDWLTNSFVDWTPRP